MMLHDKSDQNLVKLNLRNFTQFVCISYPLFLLFLHDLA